MKNNYLKLIPFIAFMVLVAFLWRGLALRPDKLPSMQLGKPVPAFHVPTLENKTTELSAKDLQGKILLLNVWASWCSSCAEEQVFLLELARRGMPIYGLNYKDQTKDAKQWLDEWGNPYQIVGVDKLGKLAIELGVYGTPETFLIDKKGIIRYRHAGVLDANIWRDEFVPEIKKLEQKHV